MPCTAWHANAIASRVTCRYVGNIGLDANLDGTKGVTICTIDSSSDLVQCSNTFGLLTDGTTPAWTGVRYVRLYGGKAYVIGTSVGSDGVVVCTNPAQVGSVGLQRRAGTNGNNLAAWAHGRCRAWPWLTTPPPACPSRLLPAADGVYQDQTEGLDRHSVHHWTTGCLVCRQRLCDHL